MSDLRSIVGAITIASTLTCLACGTSASPAATAPCTESLASVGASCEATYPAAVAAGCGTYGVQAAHGPCGALLLNYVVVGVSFTECFYDGVSQKLVGAALTEDVPSFCGGRSNTVQAGNVEATCGDQNAQAALTQVSCAAPDAGSNDSGTSPD